jgi:uncharacterized membrane protein
MSTVLTSNEPAVGYAPLQLANRALNGAATVWSGAAILGQLLFAFYVAVFYGGAILRGAPGEWNKVLPHGYIAGDTAGNAALGTHMLFAVVIMVCGALQLLPRLRSAAPRVHRWSGRLYVALAVVASLTGLYMVWFRDRSGSAVQHTGISIAALLILLCAAMAVHHARLRQFSIHRRWALRLFLVVGAVWFFRVGLMFWIFVNKGPVGFDPKTFTGPFLNFLSFAQFLAPLAVLELYLRVREQGSVAARLAVAGLLLGLTGAMATGIAVAAAALWLPHL